MKSSAKNIRLESVESLFRTEESRKDDLCEKVLELPLSELHPFREHPFKVLDDDAMREMAESVSEHGLLVPAIARPRRAGGYELIAGHRRKRACELAGLDSMRVIVRELDDDEAVIIMVDSNLQRETLLFSEKAFAYKMKVEAVKRQSGRPGIGSQVGVNFVGKKSYEIVGDQYGESRNQVYRFIRLTELVSDLLDMVDDKKVAFNTAVELSHLRAKEQIILLDAMEKEDAVPSLSQAARLKKLSREGELAPDTIYAIMSEEKKTNAKITLSGERLKKYFPENTSPLEMEKLIVKLLDSWYTKQTQTGA